MKNRYWLFTLILVGTILRVGLVLTYEPTAYPDTGTYVAAAQDLSEGNLRRSEGRRTPGYPLVMSVAGMRPGAILAIQAAGGLATSALLFYIALVLTGCGWLAFAVGMSYNLNLQQLFFEGALLSESISTLTVVAVMALAMHASHRIRAGRPAVPHLLLLGALCGVAILVRPQFVFLLILVPLLAVFASGPPLLRNYRALRNGALTAAPALALLLAWCTFVFFNAGYFAMTTQTGFGLVNHSVAFVELAPDRYATIRDILVKDRAVIQAEKGHYGNTGWFALPEMMRATGKTLPQLSQELQRMSMELFLAHPVRYGVSVARSWVDFWTVPIIWETGHITPSWLISPLTRVWWVEHKFLRMTNLAFVLLVFAVAVSRRVRTKTRWNLAMTGLSALILLSSVVQAFADYGASSRYAVTIQALVLLVVAVAWFNASDRGRSVEDRVASSARRLANDGALIG